MRFVCIDFETANSSRNSACSLGIAVVDNLTIVETRSWLIRPPRLHFSYRNVQIHGITKDDVKDEPQFDVLWQDIFEQLGNSPLIAHNASFDMSVLVNLLQHFNLEIPSNDTACTYVLSKKLLPHLPNHKLKTIAKNLNIKMVRHHEAESDAIACAEIAINICKQYQELHPVSVAYKLGISPKTITEYHQRAEKNKNNKVNNWPEPIRVSEINPQSISFDESHPFFGKKVVVTGALDGMDRREVMQIVVDLGGTCTTSVSKKTDVLIVGTQTSHNLIHESKSSKQLKAELLISQGYPIHIMTANEFIVMTGNDLPF
ncbi:MAG: DNA polymerase III subunit epsilon [Phycisphaerae bacterium]|nr:DNA polymerase III subunit epsilon [Phycisphaerae bacterium]